jgi:hypothetical protein
MRIWTRNGPDIGQFCRRGKLDGIDRWYRSRRATQSGRSISMATSHTSETKTESAHLGHRFGDAVQPTKGLEPGAPVREASRSGWIGRAVLALLIGLTAWVVSWVSLWWVAGYLVVMGLIFIEPRGWRTSKAATGSDDDAVESRVRVNRFHGWLRRTDRAEGPIDHRSADEPEVVSLADEVTETLGADARSEQGSSDAGKSRRGRGRGRRSAKTADSVAPANAAVTWIRVGPGKFVRADSYTSASNLVDPAESQESTTGTVRDANTPESISSPIEEPVAREHLVTDDLERLTATVEENMVSDVPDTDALADTIPAPVVSITATVEPSLPEAVTEETSYPMAVTVPSWTDESALPTVAEEYGIAPSAFGSGLDEVTWDNDCDRDDSGGVDRFEPDTDLVHDLDSECVSAEADELAESSAEFGAISGHQVSHGRVRKWPFAVSRWTVNAVRVAGGVPSRCHARGDGRPVHRTGSTPGTGRSFRHAARRAFGRIAHVRRTWRPRSPPCGI